MSTRTLQRILVPTGLSAFAANALCWAEMIRRRAGATLTLLDAHEPYIARHAAESRTEGP